MAINLEQYGIHASEIVYNPSYEMLFEEEMKPELTGYDKGQLTELDAVNVMTGIFTGRHRLVDDRGLPQRQPRHERGNLGCHEGHRRQAARR